MSENFKSAIDAIRAEGSEWVLRLDEERLDDHARRKLLAWLKTSPQHIEEFLLATATWRQLDDVSFDQDFDIDQLLADAGDNVVSLNETHAARTASRPRHRRALTRRTWLSVAATVVAAVGAASFLALEDPVERYETGTGQQTLFTLDDGSVVHLNTRSSLTVHLTAESRDLELLQGEAMFEVAKDESRPFRVRSSDVAVEAIGTEFNVHRRTDGVQVTVVEGTVKVQSAPPGAAATSPPKALVLNAGEEATSNRTGEVARIEAPNIEKHTAWREQRLVFRQDSLSAVAAEFNRYNRGQIIVEPSDLATRRITATFNAHDPDSFLAFLERDPTLEVIRTDQSIRIRSAR